MERAFNPRHVVAIHPVLWNGMAKLADVVNALLDVPYKINNVQRRAVMFGDLIYGLADVPVSGQKMIGNLMEVTAELFRELNPKSRTTTRRLIGQAIRNTYIIEKLKASQDALVGYMGDYADETRKTPLRRSLNVVLLVGDWARHWGNIAKTLPFNHPLKTALMSYSTQILNIVGANQYGGVPLKDSKGDFIPDKFGRSQYVYGWQLDAFHAPVEFVKNLLGTLGVDTGIDAPSSFPWWIHLAAGVFLEVDVATKKMYITEDPRLREPTIKERADFKRRTGQSIPHGAYINTKTGKITTHDLPTAWHMLEVAFPNQVKPFTELSARGSYIDSKTGEVKGVLLKPSPYTEPGRSAPALHWEGKGRQAHQVPTPRTSEEYGLKRIGVGIGHR